jgi:hypothetical protein
LTTSPARLLVLATENCHARARHKWFGGSLHLTPNPAECVCIDLTSEDGVDSAFERVSIAYGIFNAGAGASRLPSFSPDGGQPKPPQRPKQFDGFPELLAQIARP